MTNHGCGCKVSTRCVSVLLASLATEVRTAEPSNVARGCVDEREIKVHGRAFLQI
jgi:hypothetical protein